MLHKPINVRGTQLLRKDTRERYRQKIARITLDAIAQFGFSMNRTLCSKSIRSRAIRDQAFRCRGETVLDDLLWQVSKKINGELQSSIRRAAQGEIRPMGH